LPDIVATAGIEHTGAILVAVVNAVFAGTILNTPELETAINACDFAHLHHLLLNLGKQKNGVTFRHLG
jgi:hypothetical protein